MAFEGDITIELLNWRENIHHHRGDTIGFKRLTDPDSLMDSRVTKEEYATSGWGSAIFLLPTPLFSTILMQTQSISKTTAYI